jgi:hypothetical protein
MVLLAVLDNYIYIFYVEKRYLYSFCVSLFYRKRLPQQNGDRRKRDLHAFQMYVGQGRLLAPPPPPTRDKKAGLVYYACSPPPPVPMDKNW